MALDNVPNTFQLLHTSQNFEIYLLEKKTYDFQAFYKLIRHLVNLSKNLQAFLCLFKLSRDISDAPSCFRSVSKVPTYLANFSKDSQGSWENSENSQVTQEHPEDSFKLPPDQSIAKKRKERMFTAISHVALIYQSRSKALRLLASHVGTVIVVDVRSRTRSGEARSQYYVEARTSRP